MKIAGIFIAYPADDFLHREGGGYQKPSGLKKPASLNVSGKAVRRIAFHQTAYKIGRLIDGPGVFFQGGSGEVPVNVGEGAKNNLLFIGRRSSLGDQVSPGNQFQEQKRRYITGTKVLRVSGDSMAKIEIPVPSRSVQRRVVNILDRFDALTTSLVDGLPAEIEARRQQYEYYRDRLLVFPRKEA